MVNNLQLVCLRYENLLKTIEITENQLKNVNNPKLTKQLLLLKMQKIKLVKQMDKLLKNERECC